MTFKNIFVLGAFLLCFSFMNAGHAELMTEKQVQGFIESMPQADALGEKYDNGQRKKIDPSRPLSSALELMGGQGAAYAEIAELARRHGFSSPEQWADVGDRVINGYSVAVGGATLQSVDESFQAGKNNVENDVNLTADKKKAVLAGMEKGYLRNRAKIESSAADLPTIRAHLPALIKLFE